MSEDARTVRSAEELQRAHDILTSFILVDDLRSVIVAAPGGELAFKCMVANCDVLCWMLGHHHNETFAKTLVSLERLALSKGYVLRDLGELKEPL